MSPRTRRRLLLAVPLVGLLLAAVAVPLLARGQDLKSRTALVTAGMPREQVEGLLGPPEVVLKRPAGGATLIWVDQLWQVSVRTGPDGRAESVECVPSDSVLRRTVGRLLPLP